MRRPKPWSRELTVLRALAHLEETDPRQDGPAAGYGLHMLRQVVNHGNTKAFWVRRGDLTRLSRWELVDVVYMRMTRKIPMRPSRLIAASWVLTWEGWTWLAEERLAREAAG